MIGLPELIVILASTLFAAAFIAAAVLRLRKKLAADQNPSWKTYANELGGYVLFGLLLIAGIAAAIMQMFGTPETH